MALRDMKNKKWSELDPAQRRRIKVMGGVQAAVEAVTLFDLWRRPAEKIRGSKKAWALAAFVQPIGPAAYWLRGRKRGAATA
jgi:hypothetical protein